MPDDAGIFHCELFIALARPALWTNDARYGITATKRTLRHAVDRNRAKRRMRAWLRHNEKFMSPVLDYVFILRAPVLDVDFATGNGLVEKAIKKLRIGN